MDFAGQSAIVTGAARGIGLVVAQRLIEAGATVFMVDVQEELLRSAAAGIGATACPADVSDTKQVEQVVASAVDATGRIDVLFNNAGLLRDNVLWKIDDEDWETVVGVSLGARFASRERACRHSGGLDTAAS
jgi:3-oxoacyl-[acyl-carrier protein] reductase